MHLLQRGYSLIELMISMALGLLLTAGIISLFAQSQRAYNATRDIAIMDQNSQVVFDMMAQDLQRIGYAPHCQINTGVDYANVTVLASDTTQAIATIQKTGGQLVGYNASANKHSSLLASLSSDEITDDLVPNSDYFMAMVKHNSFIGTITGRSNSDVYTATFNAAIGYDLQGLPLLASSPDCSQFSQFVPSNSTSTTSSSISLSHQAATASAITNCAQPLSGNFDCQDTSLARDTQLVLGSAIYPLEYIGYGVIEGAQAQNNQLVRLVATDTDKSVPLMTGVTNFKILYGVHDPAVAAIDGQLTVAQYLTSDEINDVSSSVDWQHVIALRISFDLTNASGQISKPYSRFITLRNRVIK